MRAANRDLVPPERMFVIVEAMKSAKKRRLVYMNAHARWREFTAQNGSVQS